MDQGKNNTLLSSQVELIVFIKSNITDLPQGALKSVQRTTPSILTPLILTPTRATEEGSLSQDGQT